MANKREEQLRGGLNALFGGTPKEEQPQQAAEQPTSPTKEEIEAAMEQAVAQGQERALAILKDELPPDDLLNTIQDEELRAALQHKRQTKHRGRPKKHESGKGVPDKYGRVTTIVNLEKMAKFREIAYREALTIKELFEACMDIAIENYESKYGTIKLKEHRTEKASEIFRL